MYLKKSPLGACNSHLSLIITQQILKGIVVQHQLWTLSCHAPARLRQNAYKHHNCPLPILLQNLTSLPSFWRASSPQRQQLQQWEHFSFVSMDKTCWWRPLLVLLHTHEVRPISELRGCVRRLWKGWGRGRQAFHCNETEQDVEHKQGTHTN